MNNRIIQEYFQVIKKKISDNNFESAQVSIDKLLRFFPNNEVAYYYKGVCYFARDKYKEAIKSYSTAVQMNPAYAKAYFNLGVCYYAMNQYDSALVNFAKALIIFSKRKELDKKQKCIEALKMIESERNS